ncbi:hypothetical protein NDU88_002583 [Pleurodeles waltl]|uniref:Uncharacterized protein n=1 Tax=Pleurodeles waltl TaxID=8319 RepID=A0AAV7P9G9_PLEWA|nr:hypothetical protein NDU88_002583 [Pleurodeles waltl]
MPRDIDNRAGYWPLQASENTNVILTFHRKNDYIYAENDKELPVEKNSGELMSEVEESDVSDGNQSDVSDSLLDKGSGLDKSLNRSNFLKQFRLLNKGRTDQRKKHFPKEAGVGKQEAEEEEPGSKDTSKEKKRSDKQVLQQELAK